MRLLSCLAAVSAVAALLTAAPLPANADDDKASSFQRTDHADAQTVDGITVKDAWVSGPVKENSAVAVQLTIDNQSGKPSKLVVVESEVADRATLHIRVGYGANARMRPLPAIDVPNGTAETLGGDRHVMLIGMQRAYEVGDTFPLLLTFLEGERVAVKVKIRAKEGAKEGG